MIVPKGKQPEHKHKFGKGFKGTVINGQSRYILINVCKECKLQQAYDMTDEKPE